MLSLLRRTGADPPFSDHRHYHGVSMEGWFWRFTGDGFAAIVLCAVCRDGRGGTWGMCAVALPGVFAEGRAETAWADPRGPALRIGDLLEADDEHVRVALPDASVDVCLADRVVWPKRALGGVGPGHLVPWLGQYWHPHVLGGRVGGSLRVGDTAVSLDGANVYAEKNWGRGFPKSGWWWGQAQGFEERDVCVAFAGGPLGPLHAGALVVRVGADLVHVVHPPMRLRASGALVLRARGVEIEVAARDEPLLLPVPRPRERGVVHGPSAQHLAAELRLHVRRRARTVFDGASALAGFELGTPS